MHSYQFKEHISFIYATIYKDKTAAQLGGGGAGLLSRHSGGMGQADLCELRQS